MYDHAAVEALKEVRRVVEQLGPPILFRKLYGLLNAVEMQIEDAKYRPAAILFLGEALRETAVLYGVEPAVQSRLNQEYATFAQKLQKG
jgi:signal transduction histidine kinase